jgi:hypothetical protein
MKFYVHFSTIQPRFAYLNEVLNSWKNQSVNIDGIAISTSKVDKRFYEPDINIIYHYAKNQPNSTVQILDYDYGPHNKILGALQFYDTIEDKENSYVIICDDDLIYTKDIVKSYKESLLENKDSIYTHFVTKTRLKNINHIQGADTYVLTPEFFKHTTFEKYKTYLDETFAECEDCLYQDDYVISYYIYKYCNMTIKTVKKFFSYSHTQSAKIQQLHLDPKVHERERNTVNYFNKKLI